MTMRAVAMLLLCAVLLPAIHPSEQASAEPAGRPPMLAALAAQAADESVPALAVVSQLSNCHASPDESLPILGCLLGRRSDGAKAYALMALVRLGHAGASLAPAVLALSGPEHGSYCRTEALAALAALQPTPVAIAPVLACLTDPRLGRSARLSAEQLLGDWGPAAQEALPALAARVDDPDSLVAEAAMRAIAAIAAPQAADGLPRPGLPATQLDATLHRLVLQQPPSRESIAALIAVGEGDVRLGARTWAWRTLGEIGLATPQAIRAMQRLAGGSDLALARLAVAALAGEAPHYPGPGASAAVMEALARGLAQGPAIQEASARGLRRLGAEAAGSAPAIVDAICAEPAMPAARLAVLCEALRACGPLPAAQTERLATLLPADAAIYAGRSHSQASLIQTLLLETMASTGVPRSAHRAVLAVLANPDPNLPALTAAAARAAGRSGADGAYAVSALAALLGDAADDGAVDLSSLSGLSSERHGKPPRPRAGGASVRSAALQALLAIGPVASAARGAVRDVRAQAGAAGNAELLQQLADAVLAGLDQAQARPAAGGSADSQRGQ